MADTSNLSQFLTDVAGAIKEKTGKTDKIPAANFDTEIKAIETGVDTSDATAFAGDIIAPKTAYVDGKKITGTIIPEYVSEYTKTKVIEKSQVFDFNDVIAVCGAPNTTNVLIYRVQNDSLVDEYDLTLSSLNIPSKYVLYAASVSRIPVEDSIYNIALYVYDPSSARGADQMLYVVRFNTTTHSPISSTESTLSKMMSSVVSLDTAGVYTSRYGVIKSHPTNPNWFICGVGCNNTRNQYGRFHARIIKFKNEQPTTLSVSLLAGYDSWNTTFVYIDVVPIKDIYTWIFIKGVKNGSSHFVGLFKYDEMNNKIALTPFNEETYGASILNKEYFIYKNNQLVSLDTNTVVGTFPLKLSWRQFIQGINDTQFLLFDIADNSVKLYDYDKATNTVTLKQGYHYSDLWADASLSGFMVASNKDSAVYVYDRLESKISVLDNASEAIKSLETKGKTYIDTTDATALESNVLQGKTAYVQDEKISGTMPNNGALNYTPSEQEQTIPAGYTSGGTVKAIDYSNTLTPNEYGICDALAANILGSSKPYTELEYIQSSGTQYIDTGVMFDVTNCRIIMDFQYVTPSANTWFCGVNMQFEGGIDENTAIFYTRAGFTYSGNDISKRVTATGVNTKVLSANTYMFARNWSGQYNPASMKLYSAQVYKNDVLVRDFIPIKDLVGTACLYDKISATNFYNVGRGNFIAGGAV